MVGRHHHTYVPGSSRGLRELLLIIGFLIEVVGEIANFAAYAYAPAILVTPLGALSVLIGSVVAGLWQEERGCIETSV